MTNPEEDWDEMTPVEEALERALDHAYKTGERCIEDEPLILTNADAAYTYARDVIKGRWPEAEAVIVANNDLRIAWMYTADVIQGPWPELEHAFIRPGSILEHLYPKFLMWIAKRDTGEFALLLDKYQDGGTRFINPPVPT